MSSFVDLIMRISGSAAVSSSIHSVVTGLRSIGSGLASVGGMIVEAFSVDAIIDFSKQTFELADSLVTLSEKTGQSTDTIQKLHYAAEQTGASAQSMDSALIKLNSTLGDSISSGKDKVFKDLG